MNRLNEVHEAVANVHALLHLIRHVQEIEEAFKASIGDLLEQFAVAPASSISAAAGRASKPFSRRLLSVMDLPCGGARLLPWPLIGEDGNPCPVRPLSTAAAFCLSEMLPAAPSSRVRLPSVSPLPMASKHHKNPDSGVEPVSAAGAGSKLASMGKVAMLP
eukprot:CAMPEP_0115548206 /NCGR_PEP_ID=MMETSP0271-20121206/94045_1 /TAXON_ID=71861 /ORGANISM="Scrippsiella trochoidea, Strain CCMP3099" /LENGTH=160 /DNA_ID=CAMNT_0002981667 /DNA_START=775 /DNA_END=1254 /DNA_ORIENTATION=-